MQTNDFFEVAIIGGGAAGMMAALRASSIGKKNVILERNDRVGKKLLLSGDGKCNITNANIQKKNYHSSNNCFNFEPLNEFSNADTLEFFEKLGLLLLTESDGRIFPRTLQASTVLDALRLRLDEQGVKIINNFKVSSVHKSNGIFKILSSDGLTVASEKIILATGGKSYQNTGSDGSGYAIAQSFGHTIVDPVPALVQLKLFSQHLKTLTGVRTEASVKVVYNNSIISQATGEVLFTNYGASGPAILNSSNSIARLLKDDAEINMYINFLPGYSTGFIRQFLLETAERYPERTIEQLLQGLVHKRIAAVVTRELQLQDSTNVRVIESYADSILNSLTQMKFRVMGTLTFATAQVTSGGVNTNEINETTLESKLVKGLYFAGEVIDVNGDSGGYNLQWAWSTGWVAGSLKSE
ncbi:MAG: NAD(P)/FAD-dependent oxidoreductase [Caldisericaceae bacterium]